MEPSYQFADLSIHPEMVRDIEALENKFKQEFGETITLIAYESKEANQSSAK